ncbi:Ig-like domain-containing protein [Marinobacter sp. GH_1]|uniref:Ig-like domain-containing protein n=1 Tax=Marinobacter sp. GH_1 TaxID=3402164 RepID=UPI003B43913C
MKKTILALSVAGLGLVGCGGDNQTVNQPAAAPELYFAYPADTPVMANGQQLFTSTVPVSAPIFLRFTDRITTPEDELANTLSLKDSQGNAVPLGAATLTAGDKGLAVRPLEPLSPRQVYTLTADGLEVAGQAVTLTSDGIVFKTEPAVKGPLLSQAEDIDFRIARFIPLDDDRYPATDLSVLRVQFTEPVKASTLVYGHTFSLRDSNGELVPAEVYLRGHRLTIDPDDYLDPSQTYSIEVTDGIESEILGAKLNVPAEAPWTFQPLDTRSPNGERQFAAQKAATNPGEVALSGAEFNTVNLRSQLLGEENPTTASGVVFAELGYIPKFEREGKSVPLAISRGSLMTGSSVEVNVAGAVPAGFESDAVSVRFISDANGFLMPNPYTNAEDAPRLVELFIDMALNTENPTANAAFAQQMLHVQLVGTAIVENGTLTIEAVGVIEPDVMGVDKASGLISFRLEGFRFEADAPTQEQFADQEAPFVKSWSPAAADVDKLLPGDPLTVFFSEPLLPSTVTSSSVTLYPVDNPNEPTPASLTLNGSALSVAPHSPLEGGREYRLSLSGSITDIAGNALTPTEKMFTRPRTNQDNPSNQSPVVLTSLPGYPCAKVNVPANPEAGNQGRCAGGKSTDDLLPIHTHPGQQPIIVRFSQIMKSDSIIADDTVRMDEFKDGTWQAFTDFVVETSPQELKIIPNDRWQSGTHYRYRLESGQDGIRSVANLPLQTQVLSQSIRTPVRTFGGPAMENYFVGGPENPSVLTPLRNLPTADINSDFQITNPEQKVQPGESGTYAAIENSGQVRYKPGSVDSTLVDNANIGCRVGQTCEQEKFIYMTAMLDVAVIGQPDDQGRVPVKLYPSVLYTSELDVNVSISDLVAWLVGKHHSIKTGPMLMRMRYEGEQRNELISGYLFTNGEGVLTFETELDLYMDAPYLKPEIPLTELDHNMRSFPINNLKLSGPVTFLDDGRMQIVQRNTATVDLPNIVIDGNTLGGLGNILGLGPRTSLALTIPEQQLYLNYISPSTQP